MTKYLICFLFSAILAAKVWSWTPVVSQMHNRDTISESEVRSIFTFTTKEWSESNSKMPIVVILFDYDTPAFKDFSINVLGLDPELYRKIIDMRVQDGSIAEPIRVKYEAEMRVKVAENIYAIGYLNEMMYLNSPYGIRFLKVVR